MTKRCKNKVKYILIITIIFILLAIVISLFLIKSPKLIVDFISTKEVNLNSEFYNTDIIKKIKNGQIVTKKESIDTSELGSKSITIIIKDKFGKEIDYDYEIIIVDKEPPQITYKKELETDYNKEIDLLANVKVTDNSGENITPTIEGEYRIDSPGVYTLYYVAEDKSGNKTKEEFKLTVKEKKNVNKPPVTSEPEEPNDANFTTSKGFKGYTKNGITYIDGVLIANKTYSLPSTYSPGLTNETTEAFNKMEAAAKLEGLYIKCTSGFRSFNTQKKLYNNYVNRDGQVAADTYSARPGYSEHQSGLACDICSNDSNSCINSTFDNTPEAKWSAKNAYKYGLILRYPKGKTNETGYQYESWHFRYVGVELATKLYNNGDWITLEDYFGIDSEYK